MPLNLLLSANAAESGEHVIQTGKIVSVIKGTLGIFTTSLANL